MERKYPAYVNGPVNIIRLEGEIDGIKKKVYLFMDIHYDLMEQTTCYNNDNIDIQRYFYDIINYNKDELDIFIETNKEYFYGKNNKKYGNDKYDLIMYKDKYINEIRNTIYKEFLHNRILSKNKILQSSKHKNIRLHYIDVRNLTFLFEDIHDYISDNINYISIDLVKKIKSKIDYYINEIKKKYGKKIRERYNNIELQNKLNNFIKIIDYYEDKINENIDDLINNYYIYDKIEKNNIIYEIYNHVEIYGVIYTDIYTLRRLLDKKYITKSIIYTGASHSINYLYFLMKEYNFKITTIVYPNDANIEKISKEILKYNYDDFKDNDLFYMLKEKKIYLDNPIQCSKIEDINSDFNL